MSCMSAYSMPLWTILTKWPGPGGAAVGADVRAARGSVDLGADRLEHGAQGLVGLSRSARHDGRAEQRALLAAGDPHTDEVQVLLLERGFAAAGVLEVGVAAVDEHVPRL